MSSGSISLTNPEEVLMGIVLTTSNIEDDKFYESVGSVNVRIRELVKQCSPQFVSQLALYSRAIENNRTMWYVLLCELAKIYNGTSLISRAVESCVTRPDDVTNLLEYYASINGNGFRKISNQIKRGLAKAFEKFGHYELSKYSMKKNKTTLADAIKLLHPKPSTNQQGEYFKLLIEGKLKPPVTWEVEMSVLGQTKFEGEHEKKIAFARKWEELIEGKSLGYMATLRNLRNFLKYGISEDSAKMVADFLSDSERVRESKQHVFRFLSAYQSLVNYPQSTNRDLFISAIETAALECVNGLEFFDNKETTVLCADVSGSMEDRTSSLSTVTMKEIGILLSMIVHNSTRAFTYPYLFATEAKIFDVPEGEVLKISQKLKTISELGSGTNAWTVIEDLIEKGIKANKIVFFTDCQENNMKRFHESWKNYRAINPDCKLYWIDLRGYNKFPVEKDNGIYNMYGWGMGMWQQLSSDSHSTNLIEAIKTIPV